MRTREQIEKEIEYVKKQIVLVERETCDICIAEKFKDCYDCDNNMLLLDLEYDLEVFKKELKDLEKSIDK